MKSAYRDDIELHIRGSSELQYTGVALLVTGLGGGGGGGSSLLSRVAFIISHTFLFKFCQGAISSASVFCLSSKSPPTMGHDIFRPPRRTVTQSAHAPILFTLENCHYFANHSRKWGGKQTALFRFVMSMDRKMDGMNEEHEWYSVTFIGYLFLN